MNETMQHPGEGVLQEMLDEELPAAEREAVRVHVAGCLACRRELEVLREADATLSGALALLDDRAAPAVAGVAGPGVRTAPPRRRPWAALPRAAALVLFLGVAAAASATIPGSPVRDWARALIARPDPAPEPPVQRPALEAAAVEPEAGVWVATEGGAVEIVLRDAASGLQVSAALTDGGRAGVYASGPAATARFTTSLGRIEVAGATAGVLEIEIPRSARTATVVLNGRDRLVKDGEQLRVALPGGEASGNRVTFRVP